MSILIRQSKTDQLRDGHHVMIAEYGSAICSVHLMKAYLSKAGIQDNSNEFLFRPITDMQQAREKARYYQKTYIYV
jgi:hypothetical protein